MVLKNLVSGGFNNIIGWLIDQFGIKIGRVTAGSYLNRW
jgi:hypothetical protein